MLTLSKITKAYKGHLALDNIDLKVASGEIHGLVGVNGSGKTTLLNILSGQALIRNTGGFSGTFCLDGKKQAFTHPGQAIRAGIGMVHQAFALVPGLSVADNISLSREQVVPWTRNYLGRDLSLIDRQGNRKQARRLLSGMGIDLDPDLLVGNLSVAMKQFVEVAREMNRKPLKVLLLDEPTAVLGREDAQCLIRAVQSLADSGIAVVYVSHRLKEVAACCDSITVLENGKKTGYLVNGGRPKQRKSMKNHSGLGQPDSLETDLIKTMSRLMVGVQVKKTARQPEPSLKKQPILRVADLWANKAGDSLTGLDLTVFQGEILGITSLSGHGRTGLAAGLMGLCPASGKVFINNRPVTDFSPLAMNDHGVWMLAEERETQGLLMDHSLVENMSFAPVQIGTGFVKKKILPFVRVADQKKCLAYACQAIETLDIICRSVFQKAGELSGGNQQKVCLAHALSMAPDLLFVTDPTRGVDIAAKEAILDLLVTTHARKNMTLVISSGELEELRRICDRIAVLYQGQLFAVLTPDQDEEAFALACSGIVSDPGLDSDLDSDPESILASPSIPEWDISMEGTAQ
jgi:simple sugar transport system ATP-binding protein